MDQIDRACVAMAAYLMRMVLQQDPSAVVQQGDPVGGPAVSAFLDVQFLFQDHLDLVTGVHVDSCLAKAPDDLPAHFQSGRYNAWFDDLFLAYVGMADWAGHIPFTRMPFVAEKAMHPSLKGLADLGFLDPIKGRLRWTDKAGPLLHRAALWSADFESHQDLADHAREVEAQTYAQTLRHETRQLARADAGAAFWPIFHDLRGRDGCGVPDKRVVERVIQIARGETSPPN